MDFPLPPIGEGLYEAELVRWLVKPGDAVRRGQTLAEVLTDKATMEVPSPFVGTITKLNAEPGEQVKVGSVILSYDGEPAATADGQPQKPQPTSVPKIETRRNGSAVPSTAMAVKAAPSVRHMARKLGVDLSGVRGSGPGGRVLIDDLAPAIQPTAAKPQPATAPALDVGRPGARVKMIGLRRKIAEHMVESKKHIPHYTYVDEVDVTDLVKLRSLAQEHFAQNGVKLTYLAFFVKAVANALKEVPIANATFDESANEFLLHDRYHIGVAVATPGGLIVPVIHDADKKQIWEIAREIDRLSEDARNGKSKREDLAGGTFTVTSIGNIGGLISTPIVNYPEVAILGVGKIVKRPIYDEAGNLKPADMLYLSISCDHRIVDGAIGALFGNAIARQLKNPAALLLPKI
jgi:pyruvate dehydrogenase E2 component (dihydrolipoamide acetyltransferase)/2-oxoisovalerate dehydrogenase E2 component (dihydrolipoyl transacylase)